MKKFIHSFSLFFCFFLVFCLNANAQVQSSDKKSLSIQPIENSKTLVAPKDEKLQSSEKKTGTLDSNNKKEIAPKESNVSPDIISNKKIVLKKVE